MSAAKFDPMEYIWERIPKCKDGKTIRYVPDDVPYLYHNGFVDTLQFTFKQWETALSPFKRSDGSYTLDKGAFMSLRLFRYNGPSHAAFDPARLREGAWPDDELEYLFEKSIKPSSSITREIFWNSVKALKKHGAVNDKDELVVSEKTRKQLAYLLEKFPSPRRRLEKEVARLRQERDKALQVHQENRDATQFVIGKTENETQLAALQKLQGTQTTITPATETTPADKASTVDLKSLRKPGGKLMG